MRRFLRRKKKKQIFIKNTEEKCTEPEKLKSKLTIIALVAIVKMLNSKLGQSSVKKSTLGIPKGWQTHVQDRRPEISLGNAQETRRRETGNVICQEVRQVARQKNDCKKRMKIYRPLEDDLHSRLLISL